MNKRLLLVIALAVMVVSCCFVLVACDDNKQNPPKAPQLGSLENYLDFTLRGTPTGYAIIEYTGNEKVLTIPNEYNGFAITHIGVPFDSDEEDGYDDQFAKVFPEGNNVQKIIVPDSVKTIDPYAFLYSVNLTDIELLGSQVEFIRDFSRSASEPNLNTIKIHCSLVGAYQLQMSELNKNKFDYAVIYVNGKPFGEQNIYGVVTVPDGVTHMGNLFCRNKNITEIILPDGLKTIGYNAFTECSALEKIQIPDTVISIGEEAFQRCSSLTEIAISDSVALIDKAAFSACENLQRVDMGKNVVTINDWAFNGCFNLQNVAFPNTLEIIGDYAFEWCKSITEIRLPQSLRKLGSSSFDGCVKLVFAYVDSDVTGIGHGCFFDAGSENGGLSVTFSDNVTIIPSAMFNYCRSLKSVSLGKNVKVIGSIAFRCSGISEIALPQGIQRIEAEAFDCTNLKQLTIPTSVQFIGRQAFYGCDQLSSVVFEDTIGWKANGQLVDEFVLTNASSAASCLASTLYFDDWTKDSTNEQR